MPRWSKFPLSGAEWVKGSCGRVARNTFRQLCCLNIHPLFSLTNCNSKKPSRKVERDALGCIFQTYARLPVSSRPFHNNEGCDHAKGEASFEARARDQSRRNGTRYSRTGTFAGGRRIREYDPHGGFPAIQQHPARSTLRSWRRGNGRRQSRHVLSLR